MGKTPDVSVRFLFDVHIHHGAYLQLRERGVDVIHAGEDVDLRDRDDHTLLELATSEGRIIVTRNCCDFAPLVTAFVNQGRQFPGVLFVSNGLRQNDAGALVRSLECWIASAGGLNPVVNTYAWLQPVRWH